MRMKNKEGSTADRCRFVVLTVLAVCLVLSLPVLPAPVMADDTCSVVASVTVTLPLSGSYGAKVIDSSCVILVSRALGEPDRRGALISGRGWVSIELESMVCDCQQISIWAANYGWQIPRFAVYTSADGSQWRLVACSRCSSHAYTEYSFDGAYGGVRYIKVMLKETWASWLTHMTLDTLRSKGGDD